MSFTRLPDRPLVQSESVGRVLDPAFGLFVWAVHLLAVYIAAALACVLGLDGATSSARSVFLWALVGLTLAAGATVLAHGARRYRQIRMQPERGFRLSVTLGLDAIAALAIVWQLFPIVLAPLCR